MHTEFHMTNLKSFQYFNYRLIVYTLKTNPTKFLGELDTMSLKIIRKKKFTNNISSYLNSYHQRELVPHTKQEIIPSIDRDSTHTIFTGITI